MSHSLDERLSYIKNLELKELAPTSRDAPGVNTKAAADSDAAVSAGSAVSFVEGLSVFMRADVLNSTLFAQLAANAAHDRETDTTNWYTFYRNVLENIGWNLQAFNLAHVRDANSFGSVDKLVVEVARANLSPQEFALFQTMIDGLNRTVNEMPRRIFDSSSKSNNAANFQLGVASNAGGNVLLKMGAYTYSASQNIDRVLFFTFGNQHVEFFSANQTMLLNDAVYSQVRALILERLGQNAIDFILGIEI